MKKILSFILAFAAVSSMAVSALAQEPLSGEKAKAGLSLGEDD